MRDIGLPPPWGTIPAETLYRPVEADPPAAGSDLTVTVPGSAWWLLLTAEFVLTASAVVGARRTKFQIAVGGVRVYTTARVAAQAATEDWRFALADTGEGTFDANSPRTVQVTIPRLWLPPGSTITSVTNGLLAGDQWGPLSLYVAEVTLQGIERAAQRAERAFREGF